MGDLYTDPQLHTLDGEGYGEGNLGLRGMGLFFRTHECNALCRRLGLNPFERCAPGSWVERVGSWAVTHLRGEHGTATRLGGAEGDQRSPLCRRLGLNPFERCAPGSWAGRGRPVPWPRAFVMKSSS